MPNTTAGVITVAQSIAWQPGDRVVLFRGEFPANTTPWQQVAKQHGLELVWLDLADFDASDDQGLTALDSALARGVRLVAVSAVQFRSGLRMPLEAMAQRCHARGAELFVDAIQGLGASPLHVCMGFDYLASGGHKWLLAAEGAGLLYVRRERMAALTPHLAGWLGHEHAVDFLTRGSGHLELRRATAHRRRGVRAGHPERAGLRGAGRGHRAGRAAGRRGDSCARERLPGRARAGAGGPGLHVVARSRARAPLHAVLRAPARWRGPRAPAGSPRSAWCHLRHPGRRAALFAALPQSRERGAGCADGGARGVSRAALNRRAQRPSSSTVMQLVSLGASEHIQSPRFRRER
ncbi:MAG: aminotransferase class V-fold PLP-dependent enzyme [Sandaracinaceae bacterium]|nr:aminotransferase class V-fold PLP-dependent enzyme [Sandaracinaceae bacterium]